MLNVLLIATTSAIANSFLMGCPGYRRALEPIKQQSDRGTLNL